MLHGRLADPDRSLATDPRADPRMVAALAQLGLDKHQPPAPIAADSPLEQRREFLAGTEGAFGQLFSAFTDGLPPVEGVVRDTVTINGRDGNEITLRRHRPAASAGPLPCLVHLHGGGMGIMSAAAPSYQFIRDELAANGAVVLGVEFRNSAGALGPHPFPAGLNDCVAAVRWAGENLAELGASHVVVTGESGGGNYTLGCLLTAKREGWLDRIAGAYAQCPFISGTYVDLPEELPSLRENDNYFITNQLLAVLASTYDPTGEHAGDPLAWALNTPVEELAGMPPHVISVNELDPLRDEGLAYYRRLLAAGASAVGRIVTGTVHGGDMLLAGAIPDVHRASIDDVSAFARAVSGH